MNDPHPHRQSAALRAACAVNALPWAALAVGWYRGDGWAVALWPWPEVAMSFVLLSSLAAAIAAIWLAVAVQGEMAALVGVGLSVAVTGAGAAAHLWGQGMAAASVAALALLAAGFVLLGWAARQPLHDRHSAPGFVRLAFAGLAGVLLAAGGALVWLVPALPWPLHASTGVLVGVVFVGAALHFAQVAWQRHWAVAAPPLWGLLAYCLVLLPPYLRLLADPGALVDDYGGSRVDNTRLAIYLGVLAAIAVVALTGLFLYPTTRLWRRRNARA